MSSKCRCEVCGRDVECGDTMCPLCEADRVPSCSTSCSDGLHCDVQLEEVKPGVFKFQAEDGTFYLKRLS